MLFSLIFLALVIAVAFFHYVQGLFTSTLSVAVAVVAAGVAFTYHEAVAEMMVGTPALRDRAIAIALIVLFALTYIILRVLIDKLIPGNVMVPAVMDRVGGGVMGLFAGLVSVGVLATAAQSLPFGPSIGGYARYALNEPRDVGIPPTGVGMSGGMIGEGILPDEMVAKTMDEDQSKMLLPADDFAVGLVSMLSNGVLSGSQPLAAVHPDYLQQLFGQRIGVQTSVERTLVNGNGQDNVRVEGVYVLTSVPQEDPELKGMRELDATGIRKVEPDRIMLVVRAFFGSGAAQGGLVRLSPGMVRLVTPAHDDEPAKNHFPIGTLDDGSKLWVNKPDDPIFIETTGNTGADFVFDVAIADVGAPGAVESGLTIRSGTFCEFKRMARIELSGKQVNTVPPPDPNVQVLRKTDEGRALKPVPQRRVPAGTRR